MPEIAKEVPLAEDATPSGNSLPEIMARAHATIAAKNSGAPEPAPSSGLQVPLEADRGEGSKFTISDGTLTHEGADCGDVFSEILKLHPAAARTERTEEDGKRIVTMTLGVEEFVEARVKQLGRRAKRQINETLDANTGGRPVRESVTVEEVEELERIRGKRTKLAFADELDISESKYSRLVTLRLASEKTIEKVRKYKKSLPKNSA